MFARASEGKCAPASRPQLNVGVALSILLGSVGFLTHVPMLRSSFKWSLLNLTMRNVSILWPLCHSQSAMHALACSLLCCFSIFINLNSRTRHSCFQPISPLEFQLKHESSITQFVLLLHTSTATRFSHLHRTPVLRCLLCSSFLFHHLHVRSTSAPS
jgi:hypothetical protein